MAVWFADAATAACEPLRDMLMETVFSLRTKLTTFIPLEDILLLRHSESTLPELLATAFSSRKAKGLNAPHQSCPGASKEGSRTGIHRTACRHAFADRGGGCSRVR